MAEWISVKDRMPEGRRGMGTPCIVAIVGYNGKLRSAYRTYERTKVRGKEVERWRYPWDAISDEEIVYWMELPDPPEI